MFLAFSCLSWSVSRAPRKLVLEGEERKPSPAMLPKWADAPGRWQARKRGPVVPRRKACQRCPSSLLKWVL